MVDKIINKKEILKQSLDYAQYLVKGLNKSVTHFQAVEYCSNLLSDNGFKQLYEDESWSLTKGQKYFYTKNNSALVAFTIGNKFNINETSLKIIGTHTDSPNLRFVPHTFKKTGAVERVNIHTYGGGMWQTWFDRDLSIAGKIIYKDKDSKLQSKLIRVDEPILKIPHLAIHLTDRSPGKFEWNNETHLKALISSGFGVDIKETKDVSELELKVGDKLAELISNVSGVDKDKIVDYDLALYDCQPSQIMGINKEFISSGRLDNLGSSLPAVDAIIESAKKIDMQTSMNLIGLFDHEEIGSTSNTGADSSFFSNNLERAFNAIEQKDKKHDAFRMACARSLVISADLAHYLHPNYPEKHQTEHQPQIHEGVVIKVNHNQRYATEGEGSAIIKSIAKKCDVPMQDFIVRQDCPCGSTIGPMISGNLSIKTIDVGVGCLGMHSIRETGSVIDYWYYYKFMCGYFEHYEDCTGGLLKK